MHKKNPSMNIQNKSNYVLKIELSKTNMIFFNQLSQWPLDDGKSFAGNEQN